MFCIRCGQKLPDDAVFCWKCGTKTVNKISAEMQEPAKTVISPVQPDMEQQMQEALKQEQARRANEQRERQIQANRQARQVLLCALDDARDKKSTYIGVCTTIAVIAGLISFISFVSIASGTKLTVGLLSTACLSLATAIGVLLGMAIGIGNQNRIIDQKSAELSRFDQEARNGKEHME